MQHKAGGEGEIWSLPFAAIYTVEKTSKRERNSMSIDTAQLIDVHSLVFFVHDCANSSIGP